MLFVRMLILTAVAAAVTVLTQRILGLAGGWAYVIPIPYGMICYVGSALLIKRYIEKNAPESANSDEVLPGIQSWELTAGTGVVPKWVSLVGLLAFGFLLAIPFQFVAALLRS
jgi:hypothetical protein